MHYFDQIAVYLNPNIKDLFGSLDRETFVQAKYNKSYEDLPDTGLTLSKEQVDQEWEDFLGSSDMKAKLEIITKVYKDLETTMNNPIKDYIESGYYEERDKVSKAILDLNQTLNLYNLETDEKQKQVLLNNFIAINKNLAASGLVKTLPFDSYIADIGEQLFDLNLIKKLNINDKGETITEDFTEEELSEEIEGMSLKDIISVNIQEVAKQFPFNPFSLDILTKDLNSHINIHNNNISKEISKYAGLNTPEAIEAIANLENRKYKFAVDLYSDDILYSTVYSKGNSEFKKNIDNIANSVRGEGMSDEDARNRALSVIRSYKTVANNTQQFLNNFGSTVTAEYWVNSANIRNERNIDNLTPEEKALFLTNIRHNRFLDQLNPAIFSDSLKDSISLFGGDINRAVHNAITELSENNTTPELDSFVKSLYIAVDSHINASVEIYTNEDIKNAYDDIQSYRPTITTPHNYAFELLIEALENGYVDKELYNEAKVLYEDEARILMQSLLPGVSDFSQELIDSVMSGELAFEDVEIFSDEMMSSSGGESLETLEEAIEVLPYTVSI